MNEKNKKYLIYGAGAIAAYFLILRPLLTKFGLQKTPTQLQADQTQAAYLQSQISTGLSTKTPGEWAIIADQIYEDLRYTYFDDNKDDAALQITRVKNGADVANLIKYFGKRQEYIFGIPAGSDKDLQQFVTSNLSSSKIAAINDNYLRKGIKYRF